MRILLIEDSPRLQRSISVGLRKEGYAVDAAADGINGFWYATQHEYDVIILDLMLPQLDGLSLLRQLRESQGASAEANVLVLTARDTIGDRVRGLKMGADDYLIKPFAFDELLARVQVLTRRQHHARKPFLQIKDLHIDLACRRVTRNGRSIELSAREFALLEHLAMHQGEVVSRSEIEQHLYDASSGWMSNVVDAAVYSLRKKIDLSDRPSIIQTRRGMGYTIDTAPLSEARR